MHDLFFIGKGFVSHFSDCCVLSRLHENYPMQKNRVRPNCFHNGILDLGIFRYLESKCLFRQKIFKSIELGSGLERTILVHFANKSSKKGTLTHFACKNELLLASFCFNWNKRSVAKKADVIYDLITRGPFASLFTLFYKKRKFIDFIIKWVYCKHFNASHHSIIWTIFGIVLVLFNPTTVFCLGSSSSRIMEDREEK